MLVRRSGGEPVHVAPDDSGEFDNDYVFLPPRARRTLSSSASQQRVQALLSAIDNYDERLLLTQLRSRQSRWPQLHDTTPSQSLPRRYATHTSMFALLIATAFIFSVVGYFRSGQHSSWRTPQDDMTLRLKSPPRPARHWWGVPPPPPPEADARDGRGSSGVHVTRLPAATGRPISDGSRVKRANLTAAVLSKRRFCVKMPPLRQLRILLVALPPSAFYASARDRAALNDTLSLQHLRPLDAATKVMWHYARGGFADDPSENEGSPPIDLSRIFKRKDVRAAIVPPERLHGLVSERAAFYVSGAFRRAYEGRAALLGPLVAARSRFHFAPPRDAGALERVLLSNMLQSRYVRVVDGRMLTPAALEAADYIVVPLPLRGGSAAKQAASVPFMRSLVEEFVPSLATVPEKHVLLLGRRLREALQETGSTDPALTLRALFTSPPFSRVQLVTTEPFRIENGPLRQHAIPNLSLVRHTELRPPWMSAADAALQLQNTDNEPGIAPWDPVFIGNSEVSAYVAADATAPPGIATCDPLVPRLSRGPDCDGPRPRAALRLFRPILASYAGAVGSADASPERAAALEQLHKCVECAALDGDAALAHLGRDQLGHVWLARASIFCIHPPGEAGTTRRAFYDTILLGCIPVILDARDAAAARRAPVLPFAWGVPFHDFVVELTATDWMTRLVAVLKAISPLTVRTMQVRLAKVARLLQYNDVSRGIMTAGAELPYALVRGRPGVRGVAVNETAVAAARASSCAQDAFDMLLATLYHRKMAIAAAEAARTSTTAGSGDEQSAS